MNDSIMRQSESEFDRIAKKTARAAGHPWVFSVAILTILIWAGLGPFFHFSDTWQLVINTGTTIVTFLMVFLIQNTQNRDAAAVQLKLDELIRAVEGASNALLDLEELTEAQLDRIKSGYGHLAENARQGIETTLEQNSAPQAPQTEDKK